MKKLLSLILCLILFKVSIGQLNAWNKCAKVDWNTDPTINSDPAQSKYHYLLRITNQCNETIVVTVTHPGVDKSEYADGKITHEFTIKPGETKENHCEVNYQVSNTEVKYSVKNNDDQLCTKVASFKFPIDVTKGFLSCIVPEAWSKIDCYQLLEMLTNPVGHMEEDAKDCRVIIDKVNNGNYISATIKIVGTQSKAKYLYDKIVTPAY